MTDLQFYTEFSRLSDDLKIEVRNFVVTLKANAQQQAPHKQRTFGVAKGFFKMHPDFDQPLNDFKEYM